MLRCVKTKLCRCTIGLSGTPEADVGTSQVWLPEVSEGGSEVVCGVKIIEASAFDDSAFAGHGGILGNQHGELGPVDVGGPFCEVAGHVAKQVGAVADGGFGAYGQGVMDAALGVVDGGVKAGGGEVAPGIEICVDSSSGLFPLGLGRKAFPDPVAVGFGVLGRGASDGFIGGILGAEFASQGAVWRWADASVDTCGIEPLCDLCAIDLECLEGDLLKRPLIGGAVRTGLGVAPHEEGASADGMHASTGRIGHGRSIRVWGGIGEGNAIQERVIKARWAIHGGGVRNGAGVARIAGVSPAPSECGVTRVLRDQFQNVRGRSVGELIEADAVDAMKRLLARQFRAAGLVDDIGVLRGGGATAGCGAGQKYRHEAGQAPSCGGQALAHWSLPCEPRGNTTKRTPVQSSRQRARPGSGPALLASRSHVVNVMPGKPVIDSACSGVAPPARPFSASSPGPTHTSPSQTPHQSALLPPKHHCVSLAQLLHDALLADIAHSHHAVLPCSLPLKTSHLIPDSVSGTISRSVREER